TFITYLALPPPPCATLFPYTTLFRSVLLIPAFMLTCCTEDTHVANDKVNLTFNVDLMESNKGHMKNVELPPGAVALMSVETDGRSEEHTSELQSRENLVCRLLLEQKK